jgi:hypothetical protein
MSKSTYVAVGVATVLAGIVFYAVRKVKKAKGINPTPIALIGAANETLQNVSVSVPTDRTEEVTNDIQDKYNLLSEFLLSGDGDKVVGKYSLNKLMDLKKVRTLSVAGETSIIDDAETLLDIAQCAQQFTCKSDARTTTVYVANYRPSDSAVIVIKIDGLHYVMYTTKERFVINGPSLADVDTFGYLKLALEALLEEWGMG